MKKGILFFFILFLGFSPVGFSMQEEPREAVILLHGLGRTHRSMKKMARFLKKEGYAVYNLRYPSTKNTIEHLSDEWLHSAIEDKGSTAQKRHFVGHSLGGMLVRTYLQNHKIDNLGRIVMLAPPNQGCHVTDKLKNWLFYKKSLGPAGQQLGTGEDDLPKQLKPIKAEVGVIAGNRSLNPIFSAMVPGPDDGKVSVKCTQLEEMKDFLVVPATHTFIMKKRVVLRQVAHFLKNGEFQH